MSRARRVCVLMLVAGLASAAHGEEPQATKPVAKPPAQRPADPAKRPAPAAKADAVPEADDELLEFLGSVDSETGDQDWIDYLARTDVEKVAKGNKP